MGMLLLQMIEGEHYLSNYHHHSYPTTLAWGMAVTDVIITIDFIPKLHKHVRTKFAMKPLICDLLVWMLAREPRDRPRMFDVLQYPLLSGGR